uniref:JNK1/MAPK8-associated membrane protein-like n=1 Tax=Hirondellea gigas TaxID=1518452 RepID=A0A2P2IB02_9CRUS
MYKAYLILSLAIIAGILHLSEGYTVNYSYEKGVVDILSKCPGRYCGRTQFSNGSWSACGPCERGARRNASSACQPCSETPIFYDWLYLGFMMIAPLVLHLLSVDMAIKKNKLQHKTWLLYVCVVVEVVIASLITLLVTPPLGSLALTSCRPRGLDDWYPLLHNPSPNYEGTLYCTQEAVYPMYTMVLVGYSALLVMVLVMRPAVVRKVAGDAEVTDAGAIYSALYLLPALTITHAVLAGILYTIFPFLVIVGSIISIATYFAYQQDQSMSALVKGCVRDVRSVIIIQGHWLLHSYGIIALTQLQQPALHGSLCLLVPLPALFYILTARFSDPSVIPPVAGVNRPPTPPTPLTRVRLNRVI